MIYFSYFGNWRKFPAGIKQVAICNYPPPNWKGAHLPELAPRKEKFLEYKKGSCSFAELMRDYETYLDMISDLGELEDDVLLLCYEKTECHRFVLMRKLQSLGCQCCELGEVGGV